MAGPVAVARSGPLEAALATRRAADRAGLSRHQRLHERGLGRERRQVTGAGVDGHRGVPFSRALAGLLKDHAVAVLASGRHAHFGPVVHHVSGLNVTHKLHSAPTSWEVDGKCGSTTGSGADSTRLDSTRPDPTRPDPHELGASGYGDVTLTLVPGPRVVGLGALHDHEQA